jgi:23S rRNA pseudouridine955/2504/2580 synthase
MISKNLSDQDGSEKPSKIQYITITSEFEATRLDNFLIRTFKAVPKSRIYRAIRGGEVRINKGRVKPEYKLQEGDIVRIPPFVNEVKPMESVSTSLEEVLRSSIIYEDEHLFVLNKPASLAVHAGSGVRGGVIEAMRMMYPDLSLELVHRLDKETSGCLMVAKKRSSLKALQRALEAGMINKTYLAWVAGHWPKSLQNVEMPLRRFELSGGERRVCVDEDGKASQTLFKPLRCEDGATLLECRIITGRTHQIRVHTSANGHPIIGDDKYGRREVNATFRERGMKRMMLHASRLEINCPELGLMLTVHAPCALFD